MQEWNILLSENACQKKKKKRACRLLFRPRSLNNCWQLFRTFENKFNKQKWTCSRRWHSSEKVTDKHVGCVYVIINNSSFKINGKLFCRYSTFVNLAY